jgi:hypothetical protein
MRIERDRQRRRMGRVGVSPKSREQPLMAAVNAVEVADRDISASSPRGQVTNVFDREHRHFAPLLDPRPRPSDRAAFGFVTPLHEIIA